MEQVLGWPLPSRYREVMLHYPLDPMDASSPLALCNDVERVLAQNAELRDGEFAAEWRPDRFVVGCGPCGDSYFLDLTGASPAVFMWDHETHAISEVAPDLDRFIEDWKREKGREEPVAPARRWWQFWT